MEKYKPKHTKKSNENTKKAYSNDSKHITFDERRK